MDTFLSRYKDLLVLLVVLFAQFIGLATQIRHPLADGHDRHNVRLWRYWVVALVAPPEKILHGFGSGTRGFWNNYIDLRDTREQNQRLLAEVNRVHLEQAGLIEDARQGQRLQALLSFKEQYVYQTQPAEVIGTAGTDQSRLLYINKGYKDGLKTDMPVITPDGVVGKLKDVFKLTSQVELINDQTSGVGVLLQTTRLRGVLRGNIFGQPQIINILPDERIKAGEPVITSGGDQIFPRGLPVGRVDTVVTDPEHDPYVDVIIKPAANLSHLEEVLVVTQMSDQMPPSARRDIIRSEADGAVDAEKLRASDILAEKLPGYSEPGATEDLTNPTPGKENATADAVLAAHPIKPLQAIHPDRFSPSATQPAGSLTPGARNTSTYSGPAATNATGNLGESAAPAARPARGKAQSRSVDGSVDGSADGAGNGGPASPRGSPSPRPAAPRRPASRPPGTRPGAAPAEEAPTIPARPAPVTPPPGTPQAVLSRIPFPATHAAAKGELS